MIVQQQVDKCRWNAVVIHDAKIASVSKTRFHEIYNKSLKPVQYGYHFADDIFKCIFLVEIFTVSK